MSSYSLQVVCLLSDATSRGDSSREGFKVAVRLHAGCLSGAFGSGYDVGAVCGSGSSSGVARGFDGERSDADSPRLELLTRVPALREFFRLCPLGPQWKVSLHLPSSLALLLFSRPPVHPLMLSRSEGTLTVSHV